MCSYNCARNLYFFLENALLWRQHEHCYRNDEHCRHAFQVPCVFITCSFYWYWAPVALHWCITKVRNILFIVSFLARGFCPFDLELWGELPILPLLKHACRESDWLLCWLYTPAEVSHQRWISGNIYHIRLCKVPIRQNPLWLWNPEETSPEVRNRGISGPKNGHVSNKN